MSRKKVKAKNVKNRQSSQKIELTPEELTCLLTSERISMLDGFLNYLDKRGPEETKEKLTYFCDVHKMTHAMLLHLVSEGDQTKLARLERLYDEAVDRVEVLNHTHAVILEQGPELKKKLEALLDEKELENLRSLIPNSLDSR